MLHIMQEAQAWTIKHHASAEIADDEEVPHGIRAGAALAKSWGGAVVRCKFLRSLEEIVGPADPSTWVSEFRDLLLMQDAAVAHSKVTPEHQMHLDKTAEELLHFYRYEFQNGYYQKQIEGMVSIGWAEDDAVPVRMLPAFGPAAMSNALTHFDATLAASCHAVARGVALRAKSVDQVAPPLYIAMRGLPSIGAYGLMDRDHCGRCRPAIETNMSADQLSPSQRLIPEGDDPSLLSEHGYSVYDDAHVSINKGRYRLSRLNTQHADVYANGRVNKQTKRRCHDGPCRRIPC